MTLFELVGKIVIQNQEANNNISDTVDQASGASSKITGAFKKIGGAIATFLTVDAIKDFGLSCINAVADAQAASSQFSQVFGDLEGAAGASLSYIAGEAGIMENRMKGSFTQIAAFAKTSGMDTEDALALSSRAMVAVADSAAFYDRSLEDTTDSLQSFLKGNFENDAALGLSCTETTRNAAANALYGKSFNELSESQKQLTLLQMVEDANAASGALGQAARESDTWTNQTGNLKQAWTDFQAVLGQPILEYAVTVVGWAAEKVSALTEKFSTGQNPVQVFVDKIKDLKTWCEEVGAYASETLEPIISDLETAFTAVKDAVQPFIDKLVEYVESGQAAEDITNTVKSAIDLLAAAYQSVCDFVNNLILGWQNAVTWAQQHETALLLIATAVGTLTAAIVAYNIAQAIKKAGGIAEIVQLGILQVQLWALTAAETAHTVATTVATAATSAFGAVLSFITSPITLVIVAIGALIAIGIALYKNWDVIKAKCAELWANLTAKFSQIKESISTKVSEIKAAAVAKFEEIKNGAIEKIETLKSKISEKFNSIKDGITEKIQSAKDAVKTAIDTIKGFFDFEWSLPQIALPHFSVSGGEAPWGFGGKGSLPSVGVDWYAKAMNDPMIMDEPTIFGYNPANGKLQGGGEAGSEVVSGTSTLLNMIGDVVESKTAAQNERIIALLTALLNATVGGNHELLQAMLAGQTFKVGEREFARLVRTYA